MDCFIFSSSADKSFRQTIAQDQVDQSKDRANAATDIATDERVLLEIRSRRSLDQPPNSRRNAREHDAGANRRCQCLDDGCEGTDLSNLHTRTLASPDSRVVRQMCRIRNVADSDQRCGT